MIVSLIFTVKNEAAALPRLIDSIATQTRAPDEIIVVDGGSTDATLEVLHARAKTLPMHILTLSGANISQGRNAAIRAARGQIICSTDAGVRLESCWVEELVKPLEESTAEVEVRRASPEQGVGVKDEKDNVSFPLHPSDLDVVSGFFVPDPHGVFEVALAATTLPVLTDIDPEKFLPSSRSVAFCKRAWKHVNGYPEWLDFCEDLVFDFALRAAGFRFAFAPRAIAHFRPRAHLCAFFKQYYQYSRGDGKANLWFLRYVIRYTTYLVALPLVLVLLLVVPPLGFGILVLGFLGMFFTPYKRLLPMLCDFSIGEKLRAIAWVPIIRVTGDIAKMLGYPVGVVWRTQHQKDAQ